MESCDDVMEGERREELKHRRRGEHALDVHDHTHRLSSLALDEALGARTHNGVEDVQELDTFVNTLSLSNKP